MSRRHSTGKNRFPELNPAEPSMSAPSPMPGKPATNYVKPPQPAQTPKTAQNPQPQWQSQQQMPASSGWSGQYPMNQGYAPPPQGGYGQTQPSQGIPGGQAPQPLQYGGWQQGYTPSQQSWPQSYQPTGRGWSQPYPEQGQHQNWQGGYSAGQWAGNGYAPAYETPVQEGSASGSAGPMTAGMQGHSSHASQPIDRSIILKLAAVASVVVAAVVLIVSLIGQQSQHKALYEMVSAYDNRYCEGVYVDGIHLGGMTREEAKAAVQRNAQLRSDEWNVSLVTPEGQYMGEINSYHLGLTVHVDDALNEAWQQGRTGATPAERKAAMDALLITPFHTSTALPSGDNAAVDRILNEIAAQKYVPAVDAYASFDPILTNPFTITPEINGQYLDVQSIKAQVYDMVSRLESGTITIAPTTLYPAVTQADIQRQTALIGSHYTPISTTSTENRNMNIERACDLINGKVINPGEVFSFNGIVGARTKKNGFYTAIEYAYGKQVEGYGGGVCQVSSTIYVAAVRANMEITKREQHSLEVNYTTFGYDATVNYEGRKIDFAFRNNTSSPIYVVTKVVKRPKIDKNHYLVLCEIYGAALPEGVTYDIVAQVTEVPIPEEILIVPDTKAEHGVIYKDEATTAPGKIGYEVDSFKVKYVNGKEAERTPMYHDTYKPVQTVTYVGVSERPLPTIAPW